jgi:succinyl-CoA synthetase beta subunit
MQARKLLERYGIDSVQSGYVKSAKEAVDFSAGKKIVLKAISDKALHKSKSGLVALNLCTPEEIATAYNAIAKRARKFAPFKILAQRMAGKGIEIIIGGNTDKQFGKLIMVGLGGIYVEAFKDVASRLCPISRYDARSMLLQLKSHNVIAPDSADERMLVGLLLKVSKLFEETKISELDLNPVIVHGGSYEAVDLRMIE